MPLPVFPVTVAPTASGRGDAQLRPPAGCVVDVVGLWVVVLTEVVVAGASVVVTVVLGGAQTPTPSRWQRLRTPRRHGPFRVANCPHTVAHCAMVTTQAAAQSARLATPADAVPVAVQASASANASRRPTTTTRRSGYEAAARLSMSRATRRLRPKRIDTSRRRDALSAFR